MAPIDVPVRFRSVGAVTKKALPGPATSFARFFIRVPSQARLAGSGSLVMSPVNFKFHPGPVFTTYRLVSSDLGA